MRDGDWPTWEPQAHLGLELDGADARHRRDGPHRPRGRAARRGLRDGGDLQRPSEGDALPELLAAADVVSLHCPLTPQTTHLIDAAALAAMKPTAILVNTARGPIVDQAALRAALIDGTIAAAALDVTDPEPLRPDDPLLDAPNLIVAPHIGSATTRARERMADLAAANLEAALAGRPMPNQIAQ